MAVLSERQRETMEGLASLMQRTREKWHGPTAIAKEAWPDSGRHSSFVHPKLSILRREGHVAHREPGEYTITPKGRAALRRARATG